LAGQVRISYYAYRTYEYSCNILDTYKYSIIAIS
jgi:hypothetical protein